MYLKNIEICGFKSFADKTRIEFDRQLTAIVGPNGCGKSNVVDAIRWCLGEQSAYSLRTQQMLGVIFNGSQTRPQLGLAEVSLTFDNSTGILPMDYTEITVTRKIFRSGESEYYINKIQCRLKDIRDLFLDTGIGRSGYSIFEQGKVEFIINAKPEERRALFEEAAGVAKYKVRREETLRKLERVREDTNRVNDIMSVIKEQTSALESAVRKARLYQKYVEELKTLQTADLVKKIERLGEELKPLSYSSEELNKKIIEFTTQADKLDVEISDLKIELTALEKEKSEISFSYTSTDTEIARCELRSQNFNTMIEEYTKRRTECRQNEKDFSSNIDLLKNQLEKVKSEIENFSSTLNKANKNFKEKDEKYKKIRSKISQTQSEKNRLNALVLDLVNKNASLSNEISSIQSEVTSLEVQQKSYAQELKKITAVRDATSREILSLQEEIKELNSLLEKETEEIQKLNSECEKITSEIKNSYEKLYGLKEKNLTLKARLDSLSEVLKKDPKTRGTYAVLSRNFQGIHGTVSSTLNISPPYENLITSFLGEKLNYIVCSERRNAEEAIEYLRSNSLGYATFIVEELLPEPPTLKELFGMVKEKNLLSFINAEHRWQKLIKFLLSDCYASSGTITSESIIFGGDTGDMKLPEIEIKTLESELPQIADQISRTEEEIKKLQENLQKTTQIINSKTPGIENIRISVASKENSLTEKQEHLKLTNIEISTIEADITRLKNEASEKIPKITSIQEEIKSVENQIKSSREELLTLDSKLPSLHSAESEAQLEFTESAKELSACQERKQLLEREMETFSSNLASYVEQQNRTNAEIETLGIKIEEAKKNIETEKTHLESHHQEKTQIENKLNLCKKSYNELFEKEQKIEEQNSKIRNEIKELQEKRHEIQISMKGKEIEKNSFEKQLSEMGIEFLDAKESYFNIEVEPGQIDRLRRRIDSMGPVNLAAQDEYTNLEARYNFLLSQQQDLIKAEEDLRNAIYRINSSIKETFQTIFEQVRTNFKSLFSQLFEGGESDITLTDAENLLESGVEIYAQPPGKKLQSIASLSGGEKALTAIALLFSFFMVKPSPVCVLDEVDAPLDDANITRFLNLIKTFLDTSQFLIITHNKRTMEEAEIIYGVTMEEYGISKIISIKLHRTEETATVVAETENEPIFNR